MTAIEQHIAHILAGEPAPLHTDKSLPALLAEMRATNRDAQALQALGRFVLGQVSAGLKSSLHAEKALMRAKGGDHG